MTEQRSFCDLASRHKRGDNPSADQSVTADMPLVVELGLAIARVSRHGDP